MSYDISLKIDTSQETRTVEDIGNYTSNVSQMWAIALGRSLGSLHLEKAEDVIMDLETATLDMEIFPHKYTPLNPANGWGNYQGALEYLQKLLKACKEYPSSIVFICR